MNFILNFLVILQCSSGAVSRIESLHSYIELVKNLPTPTEKTTADSTSHLATTTSNSYPDCPDDYLRNDSEQCYKVYVYNQSKNFAQAQCESDGGNLASISSFQENSFLELLGRNASVSSMWLGIVCLNVPKRPCVNDDFSQFGPYDHFYPGMPSELESCVYMSTESPNSGYWFSSDCKTQLSFVCEVVPGSLRRRYCGGDYIFSGLNETCFKVVTEPMSAANASLNCQKDGGSLAIIRDSETNQFLTSIIQPINYPHWFYIGLTCTNVGTDEDTISCKWDDGTPLTYTGFETDEPAAVNGYTNVGFRSGYWNTFKSSYQSYSICQITYSLGAVNRIESLHSYIKFIERPLPLATETSITTEVSTTPSPITSPTKQIDPDSNCPVGYTSKDNTRCYKLYTTPKPKSEAADQCQLDGGYVASISNAPDNSFLESLGWNSSVPAMLLGTQCYHGDRTDCINDDGSKFGSYDNFRAGWPRDLINCVYMNTISAADSGYWFSSDCQTALPFICQVVPGLPNRCGKGYTYSGYLDETCYKVVWERMTREDASTNCKKDGGSLAIIHSYETNQFLTKLVDACFPSQRGTIIGLTCSNVTVDRVPFVPFIQLFLG